MTFRYIFSLSLFVFILVGVTPRILFAQSFGSLNQLTSQDVEVIITPEVPGAFTEVSMKVQSYITDVNRAVIIWKKNGETELSGTGQLRYSFTTGDIGEKITISLEMLLISGESFQKQFIFNPAEVNLIWEGADGYTPPFYRGRVLPTSEGVVRVYAIPQLNTGTSLANANNYVYKWKRNDKVIEGSSGFGKNSFLFRQDYMNTQEKVEVIGQENGTGATVNGELNISIFQPKILFYERDPLYGINWAKELGRSFEVTSSEKTLIAIPYFFSPRNPLDPSLNYTWDINGGEVPTPVTKNVLTLKRGEQTGVANIELTIENIEKLFLDATKSLSVNLK